LKPVITSHRFLHPQQDRPVEAAPGRTQLGAGFCQHHLVRTLACHPQFSKAVEEFLQREAGGWSSIGMN